MRTRIVKIIEDSIRIRQDLLNNEEIVGKIESIAEIIFDRIKQGNKILLCGNGGSASDAMHIAGEFVGRFNKERKALNAISLTCDPVSMTAISNDYSFEHVFARQVEAYMIKNDILIGISTSGYSFNVLNAITMANQIGGSTIALLGNDGGIIKEKADISIIIPEKNTARVQECHIMIGHIFCELVERKWWEEFNVR